MRLTRSAAVLGAALLAVAVSSSPAQAQTRSVQRGVDGCFAWSWETDWYLYASVYLHNRCDRPERIKIAWRSNAIAPFTEAVPADGKDHVNRMSDPTDIYDTGPA